MTKLFGAFVMASYMRQRMIAELWQAYLNPCCDGCRTDTSDCDVNPLAEIPSQGDLALRLLKEGECP